MFWKTGDAASLIMTMRSPLWAHPSSLVTVWKCKILMLVSSGVPIRPQLPLLVELHLGLLS